MDSKLDGINFDSDGQRRQTADIFMSMLDEDGQPMFNEDWIKRNIIGDFEETKNPE